MSLRRLPLVLAAAAAVAAVAAVPAAAKEGVKATLLSGVPLHAQAGTPLDISWRLFSIGAHGRRVPFEASGVFVRLRSASGSAPKDAFASTTGPGLYRARVTVPDGGIGRVQIGLEGWTNGPNGTHRSDLLFPITNGVIDVGRVTPPAQGRHWAPVATAGVLAAIALSLLVLRWRGRSRQGFERSGSSPSQ